MNVRQVLIYITRTTDLDIATTYHSRTTTDHSRTTTAHSKTTTDHNRTTTDHPINKDQKEVFYIFRTKTVEKIVDQVPIINHLKGLEKLNRILYFLKQKTESTLPKTILSILRRKRKNLFFDRN